MSQAANNFLQVQMFVCDLCFNSGMTRNRQNESGITFCPIGCWNAKNEASNLLFESFHRLNRRKVPIDFLAFDIARILTRFSTDNPCSRRKLEELFFELHPRDRKQDSERQIKGYIETLRREWFLPVGSRKSDPSGYWIITNLEDFKAWFDAVKSAPITQLSTIHRVAKHNFPVFAEQMELEFWSDIKAEETGNV